VASSSVQDLVVEASLERLDVGRVVLSSTQLGGLPMDSATAFDTKVDDARVVHSFKG